MTLDGVQELMTSFTVQTTLSIHTWGRGGGGMSTTVYSLTATHVVS